jgi:uncharacterized protein
MTRAKYIVGLVVAAALVAAALVFFFGNSNTDAGVIVPERTIQAGGVTLAIAVADTAQERERGLSGTTALGEDQGMLFIFDTSSQHSFWMKDMGYSIDILWISSEKRVVYIEKDVSPSTFPHAFTPPTPARYVLEVPAGFSDAHGLKVGDEIGI